MRLLSNYLTIGLLVIFVIRNLFAISHLDFIIAIITLLVIIFNLLYCNRINRFFGITMLATAIMLFWYQGSSTSEWIEGLTKNLPLVSLIVFVPLLTIPIKLGQYNEKIAGFVTRYARKPQQLFLFITLIYFFLSPIINLGAINLIHTMIERLRLPKEFLGKVYVRGFFTASTWAPYFASVYLVIYYVEIPISNYLIYGLLLSVLQIITSYVLFTLVEKEKFKGQLINNKTDVKLTKLLELLLALLLLIMAIFIIEKNSNINTVIMITCTVLMFTFIWCLYLRDITNMVKEMKIFLNYIIPSRSNEIVLFVTAGLFGYVTSDTPFGEYVDNIWINIAGVSMFLTIILTILFVALFSFIGVHQIVTISIILSSVTYYDIGVNNIVMASILLSAYAIGAMVSPVSPANIMISTLLNENIYKIIIRWNFIYAILLVFVHALAIYMFFLWMGTA